jgi:type VI protein secretion system component VasK
MWKTKGFKWRLWLSLILAFFLIIFLIVWFWYYAEPYTWYQNIAILIVSVLIIGGVLGASWTPWGMKYGYKFDESDEKQMEKTEEKSIENEIDEELNKSKK